MVDGSRTQRNSAYLWIEETSWRLWKTSSPNRPNMESNWRNAWWKQDTACNFTSFLLLILSSHTLIFSNGKHASLKKLKKLVWQVTKCSMQCSTFRGLSLSEHLLLKSWACRSLQRRSIRRVQITFWWWIHHSCLTYIQLLYKQVTISPFTKPILAKNRPWLIKSSTQHQWKYTNVRPTDFKSLLKA